MRGQSQYCVQAGQANIQAPSMLYRCDVSAEYLRRNDLLSRMADETSGSPLRRFDIDFKNIAARLAETQDLSKRLCANRAEENRALIYCGIGLYLCVSRQTSSALTYCGISLYLCISRPDPSALIYCGICLCLCSNRQDSIDWTYCGISLYSCMSETKLRALICCVI